MANCAFLSQADILIPFTPAFSSKFIFHCHIKAVFYGFRIQLRLKELMMVFFPPFISFFQDLKPRFVYFIVSNIPGTTRDTVEEYMNLGGIPVKIVDTAGIRETGDTVEKIGVEKSRTRAENADIIFLVLDASIGITDADKEILEFIKGKNAIILVNKTDIAVNIDTELLCRYTDRENIIFVSVKENEGMDRLTERFKEMFLSGDVEAKESVMINNVRHKNMLAKAIEALDRASVTIETRMPEDFISMDLQDALTALGEITGDSVDDEIIDRIFTRFCLGK